MSKDPAPARNLDGTFRKEGTQPPVDWGPVDLDRTARRWARHHGLDEAWCLRWADEIRKLAEGVHPRADAVRAETVLTKILYDARREAEREPDPHPFARLRAALRRARA